MSQAGSESNEVRATDPIDGFMTVSTFRNDATQKQFVELLETKLEGMTGVAQMLFQHISGDGLTGETAAHLLLTQIKECAALVERLERGPAKAAS